MEFAVERDRCAPGGQAQHGGLAGGVPGTQQFVDLARHELGCGCTAGEKRGRHAGMRKELLRLYKRCHDRASATDDGRERLVYGLPLIQSNGLQGGAERRCSGPNEVEQIKGVLRGREPGRVVEDAPHPLRTGLPRLALQTGRRESRRDSPNSKPSANHAGGSTRHRSIRPVPQLPPPRPDQPRRGLHGTSMQVARRDS